MRWETLCSACFWPQVFEYGTFADYLVVPEDARMAPKPEGLSFEHAAALPLAGGAAIAALNWIELTAGETILIVGATGGVGSYAVQLAKMRGATTLATAVASDHQYMQALGADELVDFQQRDVADAAQELAPDGVDAVLDLVSGADQLARIADVVRPGGRVVSLIFSADVDGLAGRGIRATNLLSHPVSRDFEELAQLATDGDLYVPVERTLPLERAADALALSESGTVRGKIVLTIS